MFFKKLKMKGKWIMKSKLLIVLMVAAFFLAACGGVEVMNEETYSVENIEFRVGNAFDYNKIIIDTNKESIVTELRNTRFIKTKDPMTTVHVAWMNDPGNMPEEFIESTIYVSESDIQKISRVYTDKFERTIPFEVAGKEKGDKSNESK